MKRFISVALLNGIILATCAQNSYNVSKPAISFSNNILTVKYDVTGCGRNELVGITLIVIKSTGDTLKPRFTTGDIGSMIPCGTGKSIEWNLEKDNIKINDDIEIVLKSSKYIPPSAAVKTGLTRSKVIMSSIFVPGLGQSKAAKKPAYLVLSGIVYGSVGASLYFNSQATKYKDKYIAADALSADEMFDKWQNSFNMSRVFLYGAAGAWAGNIIWSAIIPIKSSAKPKLGLSPFGSNNMTLSAVWTF